MGVAASQFFSANNADKQTLSRRIVPTNEQMEDQRERWEAVAEHLLFDLAATSGYPVRHWLQGSYKFGTQVRPPRTGQEFDIDLGVYYCWKGRPQDGKYSPAKLKGFVQASLLKYAKNNSDDVLEVPAPKLRCCRIKFRGNFHIDVPCYHLDESRDARWLATERDEWEISDPKAFYHWFKDRLAEPRRTCARRHIRYLKIWAGLKFELDAKRPSSVLLTVLVSDAVASLGDAAIAADDEALRAIIHEIVTRLDRDPSVPNPVNRHEILSDRLAQSDFAAFLVTLKDFRTTAIQATSTSDLITACDQWTDAFEHFFPAPDAEELTEALTERMKTRAVALVAFEPIIRVTAQARQNANATWRGINEIGPIPKDCDIQFNLANAKDLPYGAEVKWMVRNEGLEAENVNDLGHEGGSGISRAEHSAYNGTHHMDCIVKFKGQVIGFRRVPVIIRGAAVPPRNPLRKRSYPK